MRGASSPLLYVSGRYSNGDIAENIADAEAVAIQLMRNGFDVICPHKNTAFYEKYEDIEYEQYIAMDLNILERCDALFLMSNWRDSKGAQIEVEHAIKKGVAVIFGEVMDMGKFTAEKYNELNKLTEAK